MAASVVSMLDEEASWLRCLCTACVTRVPARTLTCRDNDAATSKASKASTEVYWAIISYACCSATLIVINKVAVSAIPSASFVLVSQFVASVVSVLVMNAMGIVDKVFTIPDALTKLPACLPRQTPPCSPSREQSPVIFAPRSL